MEHPHRSKFWAHASVVPPGVDGPRGDFSVDVDQCAWGHVARKRTRLYFCGVSRDLVMSTMRTGGTPTHWVSGSRNPRRKTGAGGIVEVHITGGSVILPEFYEPRWSVGSHGLFASRAADGTVTLTAVAWDSIQKIIVRQVEGLPDGMFE